MRLPDVVAGFDGISPHLTCITPLFPFLTPYLATPPQDVKTYFCSLLCRFAMPTPTPLSSALHLHLYRLPLLWYYPPRAYSKMFVGGLSWDTTDGTYLISTQLSYPYLQCYVHFANLLNLCGGGRVMSFFFFYPQRACEITLPSSAKSTPAQLSGTPMASHAVLPSSRSKIRLR